MITPSKKRALPCIIVALAITWTAGCTTEAQRLPLSEIIPQTGGSGTCLFDSASFDCSVTDVTDGSGYSQIWQIDGDVMGDSVNAFLYANPDGQTWQMDLNLGSANVISGVDVTAYQDGCVKAGNGDALLCLDIQTPPFADVSCRNDGPPLPKSGLCMDSATKWLDFPEWQVGAITDPLPGCEWRVQETLMGQDALMLYLASYCDGTPVRIGFNGGAVTGSFVQIPEQTNLDFPLANLVTLISADPIQQLDNLEAFSQPDDPVDYRCEAQFANMDGWPRDAIIVDRVGAVNDDPTRAECGDFGYWADSSSYWRIVGPFALHFNLGQDAYQPVAPSSFTYMVKDQSGEWTQWVPDEVFSTGDSYPLSSEDERPRTQQGCDRFGGHWHQDGLLGSFRCTFTYSDAGQACSDSRDCQGACYALVGEAAEVSDQPGVCQVTDSPFGCNAPVVDGTVLPPICVD